MSLANVQSVEGKEGAMISEVFEMDNDLAMGFGEVLE